MREDPIVFEDWSVGFPSNRFIQPLIRFDALISVLLNLILVYLAIINRNAASTFGFISSLIILLIVELLTDQQMRNITSRVWTIFVFLGIIYLFGLELINSASLYLVMVLSSLLLLKIAFVPLLVTSLLITGEVLVPKSEYAKIKLEQHVNMLAITEYAIDSKQIDSGRRELAKEQILPYFIGIAIMSIYTLIISRLKDDFVIDLIVLIFQLFLVSSGVSIFVLLVLWNSNKSGKSLKIPFLSRFSKNDKVDRSDDFVKEDQLSSK